jgi:DNA adenine methylase
MGSKARIAKHILPIILEGRRPGQWYVEPFVGLANVIHLVDGRRIGADSNKHVITLLKAVQNGFIPPNFLSEEEFKALRTSEKVSPLKTFAMFGCSFGGSYQGGYARGGYDKNGKPVNYCAQSKRSLMKQVPGIRDVKFVRADYVGLTVPDNSIIYCDPPYKGKNRYGEPFDHVEFWEWTRIMSTKGHRVFISEYAAPSDFRCVWRKKVRMTLQHKNNYLMRVEKLFTPKKQIM